LGTLSNLRNNSKPIIWFVIIVVLIGFVGIGAFSVIAENKLELFGMHDPERASMAIDGEISRHDGQNRNDALSYINTFDGGASATPFNFFPSAVVAYNRHIQTTDELKGKVLSKKMYQNFFTSDISDVDIITFLISELKKSTNSPIYSSAAIRKISASFNSTAFIGFSEELEDTQDGIWNIGENFTDSNNNRIWDEGERFIDGNGVWNDAEPFTDSNENETYDDGEEFTDSNNNGIWDDKESFTDLGDGIWNDGEEFTDSNENETYDDGEDFIDKGNGVWDNGRDAWLEYCLGQEKIDYDKIANKRVANAVESYIDIVASYEIKYKKYEQLFNSLNLASNQDIENQYLINNSSAKISYLSYDLGNIENDTLLSNIDTQKIDSEIPDFKYMELGALSTPFLTVVLILLIIFVAINRNHRAKFSAGVVFSVLFLIIIVFKFTGTSPDRYPYKEISYLYIIKDSQEKFTDSANGDFDSGIDHDCGLDNICKGDENYLGPDEDGTEDDGIVESEELIEDLNGNGTYDEGEDKYTDSDNNGEWNELEKWVDLPNGSYDSGEEFIDCGFNLDEKRVCEGQEGWSSDLGNGIWDSAEDVMEEQKERLLNQINSTDFDTVYKDKSNGSKTNSLLHGKNVILSKGFTQENRDNLRSHSSILLDVINSAFKANNETTFIVSNRDFQDNLQGYFIGYVQDEGNHFYKSNYDRIEAKHLQSAKEDFVVNNNVFNVDDFTENISTIEFEGGLDKIVENYADKSLVLDYNKEIETLSIDGSGVVEGTLLEMEPGEISNILFTDNKAYLIYMHEKDEADISGIDYEALNDDGLLYSFLNVFNENRKEMNVIDWRGEASFNIVVGSSAAGAATENIEDVYLNFNNFKSVFYNQ